MSRDSFICPQRWAQWVGNQDSGLVIRVENPGNGGLNAGPRGFQALKTALNEIFLNERSRFGCEILVDGLLC